MLFLIAQFPFSEKNMTDLGSLDIESYPIALLDGSLPNGGYIPNTPIFGVNCKNFLNRSRSPAPKPTLTILDNSIQSTLIIENVLSPEEADTFVNITEMLGFRPEAPGLQTPPGMRQNMTVHWLTSKEIMSTIYTRIVKYLPSALDGQSLYPSLSQRINTYRYEENDVFRPHIDGAWPGYGFSENQKCMVQWRNALSKLTMIIYLTGVEDGVIGGETILFNVGKPHFKITPRKGRALIFRHGDSPNTVLHEGSRIVGQQKKYVARINIMYDLVVSPPVYEQP